MRQKMKSCSSFPTDKMCDDGDTQIYNGISYRIDAVEVRDNLRNLDQHGYQDEVSEKLKKGIGVDEKLNLQSYERETITFGTVMTSRSHMWRKQSM